MIYYIEGCTCSGKSTLAKELVNYYEGFELAPEHTPDHERMKDLSLPEKQKIIFFDFLNHFETLRQTGKNYICDFSPWGVIPFSYAICNSTAIMGAENFVKDWSLLNAQFTEICDNYFNMNRENIQCIAFLSLPKNAIKERLIARNRAGDDLWNDRFIKELILQYNWLFAELKKRAFI